ncbi:hypothetical protein SAMN02745687_00347 [Lachnospiraceae bacterium NK3A20]|jgi:hypothetical protein|nr:hypothetical protein SAMN02745687_00347 [Lachnospiraceae bacterium NK3A20]
MSSILLENQYFDNECDFCKVYSEENLLKIENIFLKNRISYFIKPEDDSLLARLFGSVMNRQRMVIRINNRDIERAVRLVDGIHGVDVIAAMPQSDWCPREHLARRRKEAAGYDKRQAQLQD